MSEQMQINFETLKVEAVPTTKLSVKDGFNNQVVELFNDLQIKIGYFPNLPSKFIDKVTFCISDNQKGLFFKLMKDRIIKALDKDFITKGYRTEFVDEREEYLKSSLFTLVTHVKENTIGIVFDIGYSDRKNISSTHYNVIVVDNDLSKMSTTTWSIKNTKTLGVPSVKELIYIMMDKQQ